MGFESYRGIYPLEMQSGLLKVKFMLVKYRLEGMILLFGSLYYRIITRQWISFDEENVFIIIEIGKSVVGKIVKSIFGRMYADEKK